MINSDFFWVFVVVRLVIFIDILNDSSYENETHKKTRRRFRFFFLYLFCNFEYSQKQAISALWVQHIVWAESLTYPNEFNEIRNRIWFFDKLLTNQRRFLLIFLFSGDIAEPSYAHLHRTPKIIHWTSWIQWNVKSKVKNNRKSYYDDGDNDDKINNRWKYRIQRVTIQCFANFYFLSSVYCRYRCRFSTR